MAHQKHGCGALVLAHRCLNRDEHAWMTQIPAEDQVLLLQRGFKAPTFPGHWGAPGGLKEPGETRADAAAREAFEEIGIRFIPDAEPFYEGEWGDRRLSYFMGDWYAPPALTLQRDEVCGYGWLQPWEALGLPLSFRYKEALLQLVTT